MKRNIKISHSKSGINIYFDEEVREKIGNVGSAAMIRAIKHQGDDGFTVIIIPGVGRSSICAHSAPIQKYRLLAPELHSTSDMTIGDIDMFGVYEANWSMDGKYVTFEVPPVSELRPPLVKDRKPKIPEYIVSDKAVTPYEELGLILVRLNQLFDACALSDAQLMVTKRDGDQQTIAHNCDGIRLTAKVIRETILG